LAAVQCASSRRNDYATATLAPSKGRLMRYTVPGSNPTCLAMTPHPGRLGRRGLAASFFQGQLRRSNGQKSATDEI